MDSKWREILEQVERGELTPEEGAERLAAQTRPFEPEQPRPTGPSAAAGETSQAVPAAEVVEDFHGALAFWKRWWTLPLWAGVIICVFSGWAMSSAAAAGHMFWFYCAILPALLGAFAVILAFWSRKSRWVHVRVSSAGAKHSKVSVSLPIPTEVVGWGMETFGSFIPGLREQPEVIRMMPELMKAIETTSDPLVVEVNDKNGDEVRVYIL